MAATVVHSGSGRGFQVSTIDTSDDKINSAATGSTFIIGVNSDPSVTLTGVSDSVGNSYVQFGADQLEPTGGGGTRLRLYKCEDGVGGTGHYATANFGAATWPTMFLLEVMDTGKIVTVDTPSIGQASDSSSPYTVTSGTFDAATTLALLFVADSMDGNAVVKTESTGFAKIIEEQDNDHYWTGAAWSKAVSSTSALTPSVTQSGGTSVTGFALMVFGLKSGGGSSPTTTTATPAAGAATVSGAGSSSAASSGSSAGTSSVSGVGSSTAATTATSSAGVATVSATSNAITATTATAAAGTSTVSAVGAAVNGTSATAAAGASTVSAAGSSTAATAGQAAGAATVSAVGASTAATAGTASGSATVSAGGSSSALTTATPAAGTSIVSAVGSSVDAGQTQAVPAAGTSIVAAQGASIAAADPVPAQGTSTVLATTPSSAAGGYGKDRKRQKKFIEQAVEAANRALLAEQAETEHVARALVQIEDEEDEDEILMLLL